MTHLVTVNFQLTPHVRRETHGGIAYVIAPVVAVQEDVLNGELLPAAEIAKSILAWNNVPLPISHPKENGKHVSVNRADLLAQCVGHLAKVKFDGVALHGELWVNTTKTRAQGGDALVALTRLEMGQPLEVSTAYEVHTPVAQPGVFNGKAYSLIQRDIQPDHLALLPNEIGACPWPQCGYPRVNHAHAKEQPMTFLEKVKAKLATAFAEVEAEQPLDLSSPAAVPQGEPAAPPPSASEIRGNVFYTGTLLGEMGLQLGIPTQKIPIIRDNTLHLPAGTYTDDELRPLIAQLTAHAAHKTNCDCSSCEQHVNQEVHMDKTELVTNVLRVQKRPDSERALYDALPEAVLTALATEQPKVEAPNGGSVQTLTRGAGVQPTLATEPVPVSLGITPEQLQDALRAVMPKPDPDVVFVQNQHKAQADNLRKEWSTFIAANSAYTAEECAAKTIGDLQKLYQTLQANAQHANYGGRPFPQFAANEDEDTVPDPPAIMLAPVTSVSH